MGWFILNSTRLHTSDSPLTVPPLSSDQVKSLELSFCLSALFGTIFLTLYADALGRSVTLIGLIIPQGVNFIFMNNDFFQ